MKIASLTIELIRADSAAAQFLVRVALDGPVAGCEVKGRVVGPLCKEITTVEIAYPLVLTEVSDKIATLKGVIPEPNLWSREAPFVYAVSVDVLVEGRQTSTQKSMLALRGR